MKHTRIDAAIQDYEGSHTEALEMNAVIPAVANAVSKIENPHYQMQAMFWAANDYAARRKLIEQGHTQAFEEDDRWHWLEARHWVFWKETTPTYQRYELRDAHVEALKMDEEITFVREMESLTADQAMAYAQQWAYRNADGATKQLMVERDHNEALGHEGVRNCAIADNAYVLTKPVEFRNRQFLWENTWSEEYKAQRLEAAHAEALLENESTVAANTDITAPLRIISDYMLRFMRNNKDAKLFEAKERLESKIALFIADGFDEPTLRLALSTATSSHTREALIGAFSE